MREYHIHLATQHKVSPSTVAIPLQGMCRKRSQQVVVIPGFKEFEVAEANKRGSHAANLALGRCDP